MCRIGAYCKVLSSWTVRLTLALSSKGFVYKCSCIIIRHKIICMSKYIIYWRLAIQKKPDVFYINFSCLTIIINLILDLPQLL